MVGDHIEARRHASYARVFNIVALTLTSLILSIIIIARIATIVKVAQSRKQIDYWRGN